jgi:hypothetical protein
MYVPSGGPTCVVCGAGADTTTAGVGAAAVTATGARLTNPTGRPPPRFMMAPTAAAGVYRAQPAPSGADAEIGVAFSGGRSRLPSGPYFLGLPLFLFPSPLPAPTGATTAGAAAAVGAAGVDASGAGCSAAAGEASVVSVMGSRLNTTWPGRDHQRLLPTSAIARQELPKSNT